ncbi:MAG: hypothetical protein AB4426_31355 [Xenococcaceae cyanobacterium]
MLFSCKPVPVFTDKDIPCELPSLENQASQSEPLTIAIQVDGSGSMLGYVTNPNSRYIQTLKLLDSAFGIGGGSRPQVALEYYRSGGPSNQKLNRSEYRQAQLPDFYTGKNPKFPKVSSQLDAAIIPPEKTDKLSVIVTDLAQNGADVNHLNKKIQQTYLNKNIKGYAVGILAITSEFKGTVYTTEPRVVADFKYNTAGKQLKDYRPFYAVFLGPYSDIAHYFDKLKKTRRDLIDSSKLVIFYPGQIVSEISYLGSPPTPEGITRPVSLHNGRVAVEVETPPYELLEIERRIEQKELPINYSIPFAPLSYTLPIDNESIETETRIMAFDSFEKNFKEQFNDLSLKNAIELNAWKLDNNRLNFTTTIRPEEFPEEGIYLFTVDVVAEEFKEPSWWKEWDWSSRISNKDGSKTYNLLSFMQNLKTTTTDLMTVGDQKPVIGRFCYAIQKN